VAKEKVGLGKKRSLGRRCVPLGWIMARKRWAWGKDVP
jgi:hypothetical protein